MPHDSGDNYLDTRRSGAGYIIMDPATGVGSYKIGGGENGSEKTLDYQFATMMSFSALAGAADGVSRPILSDALTNVRPAAERLAQEIAKFANFVGGAVLVADIVNTLLDTELSLSSKIGRICVSAFGFGVTDMAIGALATTIVTPIGFVAGIGLAILTAAFVATLTIVLLDFDAIYFSYLNRRTFRQSFCARLFGNSITVWQASRVSRLDQFSVKGLSCA